MAGPADLDEIQLLCASPVYDSGRFLNFRLYACHTSLSELTDTYETNYDGNTPVLCRGDDTLELNWTNTRWEGLPYDSTFRYNGSDNLLLEFRWQGDDGRAVYDRGWYPPGGNRTLDGYSLTSPTGTLRPYSVCLRIYYDPVGVAETGTTARPPTLMAIPNPFRDRVLLSPANDTNMPGLLHIRDSRGAVVRVLRPQRGLVSWDGRDDLGRVLPAGVYFCAGRGLPSSGGVRLVRLP